MVIFVSEVTGTTVKSDLTWEALRTHCHCKHFQATIEVLHVTENSKPLKIKKEILASLLTETCVPV